jgi:hypothetical protein
MPTGAAAAAACNNAVLYEPARRLPEMPRMFIVSSVRPAMHPHSLHPGEIEIFAKGSVASG